MAEDKTQREKFKDAARELETDDDEERFDERLRRLAKAPKPAGPPKPKPSDRS